MADKFGMRPDSRETSGNAGWRFPGPSQTPDTPHAVRDHRTAETHFVGFILRRMHTGKSYINQLSARGNGNLKAGKQGEKKGGGERTSEPIKGGRGVSPEQWKQEVQEEHDGATNYIVVDNGHTYICSAPEFSTLPALNAELADDDELRAEGENGALPRTKLFDIVCPEFTG